MILYKEKISKKSTHNNNNNNINHMELISEFSKVTRSEKITVQKLIAYLDSRRTLISQKYVERK